MREETKVKSKNLKNGDVWINKNLFHSYFKINNTAYILEEKTKLKILNFTDMKGNIGLNISRDLGKKEKLR